METLSIWADDMDIRFSILSVDLNALISRHPPTRLFIPLANQTDIQLLKLSRYIVT
jgi:hypothetical protein